MTRRGGLLRGFGTTIVTVAIVGGCSGRLLVAPEGSCACSGAVPSEVPWPIAVDEARTAGTEMLGTTDVEIGRSSQEPVHVYLVTGEPGFALVDGDTGAVIEAAFLWTLPGDAPRFLTLTQARAAAEAFVGQHPELRASGTAATAEGEHGLDIVRWMEGGSTSVEVAVNANSGTIASFVDLRGHPHLVAPSIGSDAAFRLAAAAFDVPGEQAPSPPEFRVEIDDHGQQRNIWSVGLGIPTATEADVFEHGGLVEVDAVTGQTSIIKGSS